MVLAEKCSKMKLRKCAHTDSIAVISLLCKLNIIVLLFIISELVGHTSSARTHTHKNANANTETYPPAENRHNSNQHTNLRS